MTMAFKLFFVACFATLAATTALAAPSAASLPPFADPFKADRTPYRCAAVAPRERAKVGVPETCPGDEAELAEADLAPAAPPPAEPLRDPELPELYRRVLSLPGASLRADPSGAALGATLPTFSIFHVYDEVEVDGETWLEVGRNAFGTKDGWVRATEAESWRSMLVMQFAKKGDRRRVLMFQSERDLEDLLTDDFLASEAQLLYEEIEDGSYQDDYLIAIEPEIDIARDEFYLMPILDHGSVTTLTGERFNMLQVAGLNADASVDVQVDAADVEERGLTRRERALRTAKVGLTFVIDTTRSMAPFIDETREFVSGVLRDLQDVGADENLSVGLVGFRDSTLPDPRIEYVSQIYQPLDPNATIGDALRRFEAVQEARVPTKDYSEDVYAGLYTAVNELDWSPYAARIIVLITDAAPRSAQDPLAQHRNYGALNLIEDARRRAIGVIVAHLRGAIAVRNGNFQEGEAQYRTFEETGDPATRKYFAIEARDESRFRDELSALRVALVDVVGDWARGRPQMSTQDADENEGGPTMATALRNELFRGQLEYLGQQRGQDAPRFYRAWAADRDLISQDVKSMDVKVFLTRNQLDALARGLTTILEAYRLQDTGGGDFFEALRAMAAQTSVKGGRSVEIERAGDVLPKFIAALPYRSKVLRMTPDDWRDIGPGGQRELINELDSKLRVYQDIGADRAAWTNLGAGDAGLEVYPIDLARLP